MYDSKICLSFIFKENSHNYQILKILIQNIFSFFFENANVQEFKGPVFKFAATKELN